MGEKPRQEFYAFAHQALPEVYFNDPDKFFLALKEHGNSFPRYIWAQMEKLANIDYPSVAENISVELSTHGLVSIALFSLPEPNFPTEAHFIALLYCPKSNNNKEIIKYLTLEYGINNDGGVETVYCEWENKDRYRNWGKGPKASKEEFLKKVSETYFFAQS